MKKVYNLLIAIIATLFLTTTVEAASFGASASTNSVKPNGTFTVSVGGDSIGRVNLSITNGTISTTSVWVEQNYQSVTVTAGSSGVVTVTATPVTGFSDSDANIYNPGPRSVTVKINTPSTTPPTTPTTPTKPSDNKSKNNSLASLETSVGTLSPTFDPSITEYTINLSKETTEIVLTAKSADSKAKVSGAGKISLKPGKNIITITVTAENGSKKNYTVTAYLDESPKVYLTYKDKKIGIVRNLEGISIEKFETKEYIIEEEKTVLFQNGELNLIYGIDEDGHKNFYIIDTESKSIENKLIPITIGNKVLYAIDGMEDAEVITIDDKEIEVTKMTVDDYYLLKTIDTEGNVVEFVYETEEKTLGLYNENLYSSKCDTETESTTKAILIAESIALLFFIGLSIYIHSKNKRGKTHEKI